MDPTHPDLRQNFYFPSANPSLLDEIDIPKLFEFVNSQKAIRHQTVRSLSEIEEFKTLFSKQPDNTNYNGLKKSDIERLAADPRSTETKFFGVSLLDWIIFSWRYPGPDIYNPSSRLKEINSQDYLLFLGEANFNFSASFVDRYPEVPRNRIFATELDPIQQVLQYADSCENIKELEGVNIRFGVDATDLKKGFLNDELDVRFSLIVWNCPWKKPKTAIKQLLLDFLKCAANRQNEGGEIYVRVTNITEYKKYYALEEVIEELKEVYTHTDLGLATLAPYEHTYTHQDKGLGKAGGKLHLFRRTKEPLFD